MQSEPKDLFERCSRCHEIMVSKNITLNSTEYVCACGYSTRIQTEGFACWSEVLAELREAQ